MLELAFTRATSASWLLKQPDKQEQKSIVAGKFPARHLSRHLPDTTTQENVSKCSIPESG
jgi:hypothetical protein